MARRTVSLPVEIDGVRETLAAFRRLPKEASQSLRERTLTLAELLARSAKAAGRSAGPQAALVAGTVKAKRDRVPAVTVGGSGAVGRHRAPVYGLLFASEFGMNRRSGWYSASRYGGSAGQQYHPHIGTQGYWFYPTLRRQGPAIGRAWTAVADDIIEEFSEGGAG